jgi:hypothetical protein
LTSGGKNVIIYTGGETVQISTIEFPIERGQTKGNPNAVSHYGVALSAKQQRLLDKLPDYDSRTIVQKRDANLADLSALTAFTGDEFTMFTKAQERLIIRGNAFSVNINPEQAEVLSNIGYKWSGHTHPGTDNLTLIASAGDMAILDVFNQEQSVIYNSKGDYQQFFKE